MRTLYPTWEYESLLAASNSAQTTDQTVNEANLKAQVQQLVDMLAAGGNVVTGTDSPIDHTAVSTHMNLRAMVAFGVTPHQAMVSATSASGVYLNEPVGRIAPGMLADLAFLGGNPLDDITQAANVSQVMVNGYLHTVDDLLAPFAAQSGAQPSAAARRDGQPRGCAGADAPVRRGLLVARPALPGGEQALLLRRLAVDRGRGGRFPAALTRFSAEIW